MNDASSTSQPVAGAPPAVVIAGAGIATSLGLNRRLAWEAACLGRCGVGDSSALAAQGMAGVKAGQAPALPDDFAPGLTREARYLRWALVEALREAGMTQQLPCAGDRVAMVLATTLHGMPAAGRFFRHHDARELATLLAGVTRKQATADLPALAELGLAVTTCNACASGLASVALGAMLLQAGRYDLVIAGGYDTLSEYAQAGFGSLRLVSTTTQRPFAHHRDGLKLGEGYGVMVLQRQADVKAGAQPLARIAGWGEASDAHHLSQPHPQGAGAAAALGQALATADIRPSQLNLVVSHATATPDNDAAEYKALTTALGTHLPAVPCCALKSHLGHTLGGAGAVELILACEILARKLAPPAANVTQGDILFPGLDVITDMPRPVAGDNAVCLSAGFGGANVAVAIESPAVAITSRSQPMVALATGDAPDARQAVITGAGFIAPGAASSNETDGLADLATLKRCMMSAADFESPPIIDQADEALLDALLDPQRARRVSRYVKLTLAATLAACADAGLSADASQRDFESAAALLATTHGSVAMSVAYYRQLVEQGHRSANPLAFAQGVPNAGAAHLSMSLGLKGPCQTLIGTATAGLDALALAKLGIEQGRWHRVIVTAAEEAHPLVQRAYAQSPCDQTEDDSSGEPSPLVDGGVALVVESRSTALARGAKLLAAVGDVSSITWPAGDAKAALSRLAKLMQSSASPARWFMSGGDSRHLARLERRALQAVMQDGDERVDMSACLGRCFSVAPLAAVAAAAHAGWRGDAKWATMKQACVIASDFTGQSTLARIIPATDD